MEELTVRHAGGVVGTVRTRARDDDVPGAVAGVMIIGSGDSSPARERAAVHREGACRGRT